MSVNKSFPAIASVFYQERLKTASVFGIVYSGTSPLSERISWQVGEGSR
jgi:hypothetical protein